MNDVQLLTEQLRAKNAILEELEKQLEVNSRSPGSRQREREALEQLYKPLTPNQVATSMESQFSQSIFKKEAEKEVALPILKSYVGPPQGSDGRLYRGLVDLGSPTEGTDSKQMMVRGEHIGPHGEISSQDPT